MDWKVQDICQTYLQAQALTTAGERTISLDEMTGIQALERKAADLTMRPEKIRRQEFEYIRHGTQSLIASIEIWFGILMRKLLKRGNFLSQADLKRRILEFIDYFNWTMAKPFKWTYKGKALTA